MTFHIFPDFPFFSIHLHASGLRTESVLVSPFLFLPAVLYAAGLTSVAGTNAPFPGEERSVFEGENIFIVREEKDQGSVVVNGFFLHLSESCPHVAWFGILVEKKFFYVG